MQAEQFPTSLLVIADSNFVNICADADAYVNKLKDNLAKRRSNGVSLVTVPGKYGISNIDKTIPELDVDDKNKTSFVQTLENASLLFDELIVVSIADSDNYIVGAKEVMTSLNKCFTHYRYVRR